MSKYTFTFKKGDATLEYITTDKESMERQFQIWVTCASVWAYNQEKIEKGLMPEPEVRGNICEEQVENNVVPQAKSNFNTEKISENKPSDFEKSSEEKQEPELEHIKTQQEEMDEIERESQRIIQEYKAEMEAEKRKEETEKVKDEFKQEIEVEVAKEEAVKNELSNLYEKPETINDIQENQPEEQVSLADQFDAFLQKSMSNPSKDVKEKQDDRFLRVLKCKNVTEKIDLLIVTAYYLSEFERLDRFTLKLVNAKLMENLHDVVDNVVLQQAIDKGLVECLPNYTNIPSATEYRLTEAGEAAFLNGSASN